MRVSRLESGVIGVCNCLILFYYQRPVCEQTDARFLPDDYRIPSVTRGSRISIVRKSVLLQKYRVVIPSTDIIALENGREYPSCLCTCPSSLFCDGNELSPAIAMREYRPDRIGRMQFTDVRMLNVSWISWNLTPHLIHAPRMREKFRKSYSFQRLSTMTSFEATKFTSISI